MLGQNHRAIAKQRHGSHRVTQLAKVSALLMAKQLVHRFRMNRRDVFSFFQPSRFQFCGNQCWKFL